MTSGRAVPRIAKAAFRALRERDRLEIAALNAVLRAAKYHEGRRRIARRKR